VNNRADDITDEPRARGVCRKCGELAHSPYRCYDGNPSSTVCKCGRLTGGRRLRYCDDCVPADVLAKRLAKRARQAIAA
jgi:hypothetical protein